MKHFMQPRNAILRETHDLPPHSPSPNASSLKRQSSRKQKSSKENAPPSDLNPLPPLPPSAQKSSPAAKLKSPLPPRPPNPLKRKLAMDTVVENAAPGTSDSGVKVIVRMRPPNKDEGGEMIVQKISNDSLSVNGHTFTFDSVADTESTQLDIYQLVGAPLVENCLAGFNSSVFAYGQTGSGKTYTMWGPACSLSKFSSDQQGLTSRVFEQLFARINEEKIKHHDKQLEFQCRCSFLEIYNEQITDLLDPNQRNLQIREDVNSGVYVEDLTEESVLTTKDVAQLLMKGLSNRRTGATSINAESSRSHTVFTCVLESRSKSKVDGSSSFKTSRINLVDLAGSERQKLTGAAGERLKEAGNINRSLSQLGNLINILAEISQTGKQRHIPYRDSRLTFLLQESLGGNAKLAMVCAISPDQSCRSETFSTLRFAQRAKAIKNKAIINEETHEDVNSLREVIRQLKDELLRMKSNCNNPADVNSGFARRSLNLLKLSFNRPMMLTNAENNSDEEMEIDEEAVEHATVPVQGTSSERNKIVVDKIDNYKDGCLGEPARSNECIKEHDYQDTNVNMEDEIFEHDKNEVDTPICNILEQTNIEGQVLTIFNTVDEIPSEQHTEEKLMPSSSIGKLPHADIIVAADTCASPNLDMATSDVSTVSKFPTLSVSPIISCRKSLRTSSMSTASQKDLKGDSRLGLEGVYSSSPNSTMQINKRMSPDTIKNLLPPTENLAASLHRGLEIMDSHRHSSTLRQSLFRFAFKPAESNLILPVDKVDVGVQTVNEDIDMLQDDPRVFLCTNCKCRPHLEAQEANDSSNTQLVPAYGLQSGEKFKKQVPKAVEKVLAGSFRREMALEEFCAKQNAEIVQLNRLVQQYKHERECNAILGQTREDKILRLESLMDGVLPTEDFMEEEFLSLTNEHKLLNEKYENHPEVLSTRIELERVQYELESYRNFFDLGEREVLLEEIRDLRSQLQYYTDIPSTASRKRRSLLQLTGLCEPHLAPPQSSIPESITETAEEKLEEENIRWTEAERKWISLAEELRMELEASRSLAEKQKRELDTEKKCAEELKEAMQMAMQGHARMLEHYADLEEKHMHLLARQRRIHEGIDDVKKAAAKARVKGPESKFINALAAEISALKVERENERQYLRNEIKGLQAQLRDTAEAVQAAGELLVRLKEAEEAAAAAQKQAMEAEEETEKAYKRIDKLKKRNENEKNTPNLYLAESGLLKEAIQPACYDSYMTKYDLEESNTADDQQWRDEFQSSYYSQDAELAKLTEPSWFTGYDRCNI